MKCSTPEGSRSVPCLSVASLDSSLDKLALEGLPLLSLNFLALGQTSGTPLEDEIDSLKATIITLRNLKC